MVKNIYKGSFLFLKPLVKKLYKLFKSSDDLAAVVTILLFKRTLEFYASQLVHLELKES